jgi:hypothetical protein
MEEPITEEPITWDQLLTLMGELRQMARALLAREGNAQSIQPTGLVLSALRRQVPGGTAGRIEVNWDEINWPNRRYFFGAMYQAMWRAIRDHARKRNKKHGGRPGQDENEIALENLESMVNDRPEQVEALVMAIERLRERHPDWAELVEHHYFSGYSWGETAQVMGVGERTARRHWEQARLLLYDEIRKILDEEDIIPEGPDEIADE